jgi:DNA-binding CsgD family transcriptional regulator
METAGVSDATAGIGEFLPETQVTRAMHDIVRVNEDGLEILIADAYEAALDPAKWQTVLDHLAGAYRASSGIYTQGPAGSRGKVFAFANINMPDPIIERLESQGPAMKPWRAAQASAPEGTLLPIFAMIDEASFQKSAWYTEFLAPRDVYYSLTSILRREGREEIVFTIGRPRRLGDFARDEIALTERLLPHLQRAVRMHRCLAGAQLERRALLRGLEGLGIGVVLAAADGVLLFANGVAELVLRRGDGLGARRGRLHAATPTLTHALLRCVHDAAETGAGRGRNGGGALALPRRVGGNLHLLICPMPIAAATMLGPTSPTAIIFINGSGQKAAARQDELRVFYGLSTAEAKLVGALLAGISLGEYAERRGIAMATAKTQLRSVFAKTGQNRQADLVRHILSNPILQLSSRKSGVES